MTAPQENIPYGFCHCGCGSKTKVAVQSQTRKSIRKGDHFKYIHGHNGKGVPRTQECRNKISLSNTTHGHTTGRTASSTFTIWFGMLQRCHNPKRRYYYCYGGRGIKVCDRWLKFENFLADMGERPTGLTIERINNDGNYEPGNCKWATYKEQALNKRKPRVNR